MQGYIDLVSTKWNPVKKILSGKSRVVTNDPYVITIAGNGYQCQHFFSNDVQTKLKFENQGDGLMKLQIDSPVNQELEWALAFR